MAQKRPSGGWPAAWGWGQTPDSGASRGCVAGTLLADGHGGPERGWSWRSARRGRGEQARLPAPPLWAAASHPAKARGAGDAAGLGSWAECLPTCMGWQSSELGYGPEPPGLTEG